MNRDSGREVFCIGEALMDIIFIHGKPAEARPGGSLLNSAVSLARAGIPVRLISENFPDTLGEKILRFLDECGVSTASMVRYTVGNTPLALAFLNDAAEASYDFYKQYPETRMDQPLPSAGKGDIVLFGSIFSVLPEVRPALRNFLEKARNNGALIIYDPNFRRSRMHELTQDLPRIRENISCSDIVRGSDEDFLSIFASDDPDQVYDEILKSGGKILIITRNKKDVLLFSGSHKIACPVPSIVPVSTIGAGDAFNAGLIADLVKEQLFRDDLVTTGEEQWRRLINEGIRFATEVCLSLENYISAEKPEPKE
jgi:fructokinase